MNKLEKAHYTKLLLLQSVNSIIINSSNELIINIKHEDLLKVLTFDKLHTMTQGKLLMDIAGVDYPHRNKRFELNYNILSLVYFNFRTIYKINIYQDKPVQSVMQLYNSANWLEREAWDMFGIFFKEHQDLRRILTDYGFEGYPLRKDFPLTGYLQFRYDDEAQTVVSEPVELTQEYRNYEYIMPWTINK